MRDGTMGKSNYVNSKSARMRSGILGFAASLVCGFIFVAGGTAQTAGPIRPVNPPAASPAPVKPAGVPVNVPGTPVPVKQATGITLTPPTIPIEQIIQKFAAKESAFKEARGNYTYTQTVTVKDFEPTGEQAGEYHMVADIIFTPEGKRFENVTFAPMNTLATPDAFAGR